MVMRGHTRRLEAMRRGSIVIFVLVFFLATVEIGRSFVLIGSAMLWQSQFRCLFECYCMGYLYGATYILVSGNEVAHVRGRILVELLVVSKDEDGDIDGAEHGELVCLLEQAALALEKGPK